MKAMSVVRQTSADTQLIWNEHHRHRKVKQHEVRKQKLHYQHQQDITQLQQEPAQIQTVPAPLQNIRPLRDIHNPMPHVLNDGTSLYSCLNARLGVMSGTRPSCKLILLAGKTSGPRAVNSEDGRHHLAVLRQVGPRRGYIPNLFEIASSSLGDRHGSSRQTAYGSACMIPASPHI